jgi:hypothetical protein
MAKRSVVFDRIVLVLAALAAFGAAAWAGFRLYEPVPIPPIPPTKASVSFDSRVDVRKNGLFGLLHSALRGDVEPGIVGHVNPFATVGAAGAGSSGATGTEQSRSGGVREISLNGGLAVAFARANNAILLLVETTPVGAAIRTFELRRYAAEGEPSTVGRWTLEGPAGTQASPDAFVPAVVQVDGFGKVWFLSTGGYIGTLQTDGTPSWNPSPVFKDADAALVDAYGSMAVDGAGRLWATDGKSVIVGNGVGFETFDVTKKLSDDLKMQINAAKALVTSAGVWGNTPMAVYAAALSLNGGVDLDAPRRVEALPDGRMTIMTAIYNIVIPLTITGNADVLMTYGTSGDQLLGNGSLALSPAMDGSLWAVRGSEWIHLKSSSTQPYMDPLVLPNAAASNYRLAVLGTDALYALDYSSSTTVIWKSTTDGWTGSLIPAASAQPDDVPQKAIVDGQGNVWVIMKQKGLLLVQPSSSGS